jgi:hypothetical protein
LLASKSVCLFRDHGAGRKNVASGHAFFRSSKAFSAILTLPPGMQFRNQKSLREHRYNHFGAANKKNTRINDKDQRKLKQCFRGIVFVMQ